MDIEGTTTDAPSSPETVAVIGAGPGGMFICHSLETQKRDLEARGEDTSHFPIVKIFERAEGAGGVWRADRTHEDGSASPRSALDIDSEEKKDDDLKEEHAKKQRKFEAAEVNTKTNMYSGLWTNGPKECFEFYDYTFKEHWGDVRIPTHLPRKHIVDYLEGRVTKNCPDFFEKYFSFRTTVKNVTYLEDKKKFRVSTFDANTETENVELFDKCVWAAGKNGLPNIPKPTWEIFKKGCYPGRMFHSCDTSTFKEDVEGKNVFMIGGGYSAEDLAYMAIKEGVNKIYIMSRYDGPDIGVATRWPDDKVEVIEEMAVKSVSGKDVTLRKVYYSVKKRKYIEYESESSDEEDEEEEEEEEEEKEEITKVLSDIDTVIFCTGYNKNTNMLDPSLCKCLPHRDKKLSVPEGWVMEENWLSDKVIGDCYKTMRPKNEQVVKDRFEYYPFSENLYKACFNIDNPNMMFVHEFGDTPIMSVEISAWMIIKTITGQIPLPSPKEMRADCTRIVGDWLNCNTLRYEMDWKYQEKMDKHLDDYDSDEISEDDWDQGSEWNFWFLGEMMCKYKYPVSYIDDPDKDDSYSKYHKLVSKNDEIDYNSRHHLGEIVYDKEKEKDGWRTFRDYPGLEEIESYFTGIKAKNLDKPWSETHEDEKLW